MADELTFVTGATGFIGSHVVRLLRQRGDRVRILARNSSPASNIEGLDCEIVIGDLKDASSLVRCVQGCRRVYHVAADYRLWAKNTQDIYDSNVAGTRNLLSACTFTPLFANLTRPPIASVGTSANVARKRSMCR